MMIPRSPRMLVVAATCAVGLGLAMFDNTAVTVALPSIGRSLDADLQALQWVFAMMALAAATTLPLSGAIGDRLGARRAIRVGLAVFGASALVAALAPSVQVLLAARVGQGVGVALMLPNGAALLGANTSSAENRGRTVGTWIMVSSVGLVAGPLAGGWLVAHAGWQAIFLVHLPVALLGMWGTRQLEETPLQPGGRLDVRGAAVAGTGLALMCLGLIELGKPERTPALVVGALAGSVLLLTVFVRMSRRAVSPVVDLTLFRSPAYSALLVASLLYNGTIAGGTFLMSLLFQDVRGLSSTTTGLLLLAATIGMPVGGQVMGRLAHRTGLSRTMGASVAALAAAYVLVAVAALGPLAWVLVPLAVTGFTAGVLYSGDTLVVLGTVAAEKASSGLAALSLVRQIGAVLGVAVLGSLSAVLEQAALVDVGIRAGLVAAGVAVIPCIVLFLRYVGGPRVAT